MTVYTNITKPSGTSYTNQNSVGKEQFDQNTLSYDDTSTFYDGLNQSLYTNVLKPTLPANITRGMITGLMIPLTYNQVSVAKGGYTKVNKPT